MREAASSAGRPFVSLVIPAHNEERRLIPTLDLYGAHLRARWGGAFEIVMVANGCRDRTVAIANGYASRHPWVRAIDIPTAIGKGGAIREGLRLARGARVAFADADGATDPTSLLALVDALDRVDVAIGSRRVAGSRVVVPQGPVRRALGLGFSLAVRALLGLPYRDTQCGAKALTRAAALAVAERVTETRWAFDVDLLLTAHELGYAVAELPVSWSDRPGSRLRLVPTSLEVGRSLWRLRGRAAPRRLPHAGRPSEASAVGGAT